MGVRIDDDTDQTPPPERCPYCNEGQDGPAAFMAMPEANLIWMRYHCGTRIWGDGGLEQHAICRRREARAEVHARKWWWA